MQSQESKQDAFETESVLLTGGLGYIGSHCTVQLFQWFENEGQEYFKRNFKIVVLDDLSNCVPSVLERIRTILRESCGGEANRDFIEFVQLDVLDTVGLQELFQRKKDEGAPFSYIVHFAGKKAVGESVKEPIKYFENNFVGAMNLIKMMLKYNCKNFLFSSTATAYGCSSTCTEGDAINPLQPYAESKICVEFLMRAQSVASPDFCFIVLRYFNPAGAHKSGLIGDSPSVYPNNLFPFIEQVAIGKREKLMVFGNDYKTHDGTGVRDYIHILDLIDGHIAALKKMRDMRGYQIYNLGTGHGQSVLDIVAAYSNAIGRQIPYELAPRRKGDVDILQAKVDKANRELNWEAKRSLQEMCSDSYNFIQKNPDGLQ